MARIEWTARARADAEQIQAFVSRSSPERARQLSERIAEAVRRLADFPRMGKRIGEWDSEEIRQLIATPYRVLYRVRGDLVEILAVQHGARLPGPEDFPQDQEPPEENGPS